LNDDHQTKPIKTQVSIVDHVHRLIASLYRILGREIWELEYVGHPSIRARVYHLLRILTLTWQGLRRNMIPVQAAALTFYSMIGIGPLIAFAIMLSGFVIQKGNEELIIEGIAKAIAFAAPQIALDTDGPENGITELNPQILELITSFSQAAQSGTVGAIGALMLAFIGLQVLSSIESSFNSLWGVEQGRRVSERIVVYWTFVSLGAVLGSAALTMDMAAATRAYLGELPLGGNLANLILLISPLLSYLLLVVLLAVFFRFFPNTTVEWKPAFIGAGMVVLLLHVYKLLSFLYVRRVVDTNSLYGSVGIIIVLMLGLYVFWLLILLGGQVTYALQNADYLTNENAWQQTSIRSREIVSLAILLLVADRFQSENKPILTSELHKRLRVPSHILNACTNRLLELNYICTVDLPGDHESRDRAFNPSRPVEGITIGTFRKDFECYGNNEGVELLQKALPKVSAYLKELVQMGASQVAATPISELTERVEEPPEEDNA